MMIWCVKRYIERWGKNGNSPDSSRLSSSLFFTHLRANEVHARDQAGGVVSQARFMPFGEPRWPAVSSSLTDFSYSG